MAPSPKMAVRVDADLLAWLDVYAAAHGSSRSAIVNTALSEFRELAKGGMPDLKLPARDGRSAARSGKVRGSGGPSSPGSASPAVSRPAVGDAPALERLEDVVIARERERFGAPVVGAAGELLRVRRRIRMGRVQVAGKVVTDPDAPVDPSEVSV